MVFDKLTPSFDPYSVSVFANEVGLLEVKNHLLNLVCKSHLFNEEMRPFALKFFCLFQLFSSPFSIRKLIYCVGDDGFIPSPALCIPLLKLKR